MTSFFNKIQQAETWAKTRSKKRRVIARAILIFGLILLATGIVIRSLPLIIIGSGISGFFLLSFVIGYLYFKLGFGLFELTVVGCSMMPAIHEGDHYVCQKASKFSSPLRTGDIVIISNARYKKQLEAKGVNYKEHKHLIKRLVLAGEGRVKCIEGDVFVMFSNSPKWQFWGTVKHLDPHYSFGPYTLAKDEVFFLGDNVLSSIDSRYKEGRSHLDCLYKIGDIEGVVVGTNYGNAVVNLISGVRFSKYAESQIIK